jgi:hypothetical protein
MLFTTHSTFAGHNLEEEESPTVLQRISGFSKSVAGWLRPSKTTRIQLSIGCLLFLDGALKVANAATCPQGVYLDDILQTILTRNVEYDPGSTHTMHLTRNELQELFSSTTYNTYPHFSADCLMNVNLSFSDLINVLKSPLDSPLLIKKAISALDYTLCCYLLNEPQQPAIFANFTCLNGAS